MGLAICCLKPGLSIKPGSINWDKFVIDSDPRTIESSLLSGDTELEGLELTDKLPTAVEGKDDDVAIAIPALTNAIPALGWVLVIVI